MDNKTNLLTQEVGDTCVVADMSTNKTYVVEKKHHASLLEELEQSSRRTFLKRAGVTALATPIITTGLLATPAAASSAGVTIELATTVNEFVDATVVNPMIGPNPLVISAAVASIVNIVPPPGVTTRNFSLSTVTGTVPTTVPQGGTQLYEFMVVDDGDNDPGFYLIVFSFVITTATGTCEAQEAVVVSI